MKTFQPLFSQKHVAAALISSLLFMSGAFAQTVTTIRISDVLENGGGITIQGAGSGEMNRAGDVNKYPVILTRSRHGNRNVV